MGCDGVGMGAGEWTGGDVAPAGRAAGDITAGDVAGLGDGDPPALTHKLSNSTKEEREREKKKIRRGGRGATREKREKDKCQINIGLLRTQQEPAGSEVKLKEAQDRVRKSMG